jgi:hypothetical protein
MGARRPDGTGSLVIRRGSYYGQWRAGGRQVMHKLGAVRQPGTRDELTRTQAEGQLRQRMGQETIVIARHNRMTVERAGERYLHHLEHLRSARRRQCRTTAST